MSPKWKRRTKKVREIEWALLEEIDDEEHDAEFRTEDPDVFFPVASICCPWLPVLDRVEFEDDLRRRGDDDGAPVQMPSWVRAGPVLP